VAGVHNENDFKILTHVSERTGNMPSYSLSNLLVLMRRQLSGGVWKKPGGVDDRRGLNE